MVKKFFVAETEAQGQVRAIAAELEAIRFRLLGVRAGLAVPLEEPAMQADEMDADVATEVRSVVECVISDFLDSAIRDLRMVADYVPKGRRT